MAIKISGTTIVNDSRVVENADKIVFHNLLKKNVGVEGLMLLSTCNRTEIYCESANGSDDIKNWLLSDQEYKSFAKHLYIHQEEDAIEHLFKVVAGLDSMVIGESEVLGQVKTAYKTALENKSIDGKLKRLFEYSFSVAKNVRTNTDIGGNAISFMYCLLYTSPSPRDRTRSRMPSSA
mgnify:CR=1 FL=1